MYEIFILILNAVISGFIIQMIYDSRLTKKHKRK